MGAVMIPVQGYKGSKVAVLGLGRSGLATATALQAGGAEPLLWDDSLEARTAAEAEGFTLTDLTRNAALEGVVCLVTSPGIPHLFPAPHPVIARALEAGVPVDNDIGLFFQSAASGEWAEMETPAEDGCGDRLERQVDDDRTDPSHPEGRGSAQPDGGEHRQGGPVHRPATGRRGGGAGAVKLPDRIGPCPYAGCGGLHQPVARSPGPARRDGGIFRCESRLFMLGGPDRAVIGVDEVEGRFLAGQLAQGGRG